MTLLQAAVHAGLGGRVAAVATFDHGTGAAATRAARLVERTARQLGLRVEVGRPTAPLAPTEAAWRGARFGFLRAVAKAHGASVVTAHTRDDQRETIAFRILRQAGARGLAGLAADGAMLRPWLGVSREAVAAWAAAHGVRWVEDPANRDLRYARNRLRWELLPALEAAVPGFGRWLDKLGQRAATWRTCVESLAEQLESLPADGEGVATGPGTARTAIPRTGVIAARAVTGYTPAELAVLWPALLARRGVTVDRRGTARLSGFSTEAAVGARIPLSGSLEVVRARDGFVVRDIGSVDDGGERALVPGVQLGAWHFSPDTSSAAPWRARMPEGAVLTVRSWRAGDRLQQQGVGSRRIARVLSDAGVAGPERAGWPVVLADGVIVWIPGVRCGDVAGPDEPAVEWGSERRVG